MLDPDPDRTSPRVQTSLHWSRAAGREYSCLAAAPARRTLSALAKRAARCALQCAWPQAPLRARLPAHVLATENHIVLGVEISFISDAEMQELNASYRGKNKPTDVLSFCQLEGETMPFPDSEILLGDVMISITTAMRQARELNHAPEHEVAFLTAHGTLHLCGFDHDTAARRRAMWQKQDAVVQLLGFA